MIISAPFGVTGYGYTGYNITKQLIHQHSNVTIYPIGHFDEEMYREVQDYDWRIRDSYGTGDCLKIWHQFGLHEFSGDGEKIGFPIFELDTFTEVEKRSMKHCDRIFVCSKWAQQVIENNIPGMKTAVVPLGVDRNIFNEHNNSSRRPTVFFNCGKWEIRKGHDLLINAFNQAFTTKDDVELWMMCDNPFIGEDGNCNWENKYKITMMGHKIKFIPRQQTHQAVYNIMRQVDCGVFPARAEGWNLELLECLSCGKHVIATNYAGHTEFINNKNAMLLDVAEMTSAYDGKWFFNQGNWAEPNVDQLVHHLQRVHQLKQNGELDINLEGIATAREFTWANSAHTILSELNYV